MPYLGEIKKAIEVGHKGKDKYIWAACDNCGKERWVPSTLGKPRNSLCIHCVSKVLPRQGELNGNWKGGRLKMWDSYIQVIVTPDDFFFPMANKRYILEHRLVMAKHLNRCLLPWEVVHHKNGIKDDNRPENLELLPHRGKHNTLMEKEIKRQHRLINQLQARVVSLEAENILLNERLQKQGTAV